MNKKIMRILAANFLMIGLIGCGRISQEEYDILKTQNENLKREIEDLKFGPDRLLGLAKVNLDNKDFSKAKSYFQTLIDKHPVSQQANEAQQLLIFVENGLKEQEIAEKKAILEKEKAEKERLASITKKLTTRYDDIREITWYYDKSTPQYTNYNSFHLYMGKERNGKPWLRFRIQYAADDWLFIQSYIIKTDNKSYTINTSYGEIKTDNGYGGIWEWYDVAINDKLYTIVNAIINSKSVKIRHNGKQYYKDRALTKKEKQGLQNILDAYEALGGTTNF